MSLTRQAAIGHRHTTRVRFAAAIVSNSHARVGVSSYYRQSYRRRFTVTALSIAEGRTPVRREYAVTTRLASQ